MKHPKYILTTGGLLTWLEENHNKVFHYYLKENGIDSDYPAWRYECLKRNETLMQTPLFLGQFVSCKNGKILEDCTQQEYNEAGKTILFEGWELNTEFEQHHLENKKTKQIINAIKIRIGLNQTIEDLIREFDLVGTERYFNLVFKL